MRLLKTIQLSFGMLLHGKLRSWLTVIGIFIGVAAVIAIISLGQGLQQNVQSQIQGFGQDILTLSAGSSRAFGGGERGAVNQKALSDKDIQAIRSVPGVKEINGIVSGRATVRYHNLNTSSSIQGWDSGVFKDFISASLDSGRYLSQGDAGTAVIGYGIANTVFGSKIIPGYLISINDKPFRVVGIIATTTGIGGTDNNIYVSIKDARNLLNSTNNNLGQNEYSTIAIKVSDPNYISDVSTGVENALISERHVSKLTEDFSINSAQALQQRFSTITSSITLFLAVIAAVSLIVGGIGVANTMFTSVLEKTRDIGIMKAVGAKNSDIMKIFLFNSGMLGFAGGFLGVIAGVILAFILPSLGLGLPIGGRGGISGVVTSLNYPLLLFALLFSIIIGMISGAIPAYQASRLKPVEALRYE